MADEEKVGGSDKRISDAQRMRYIGFDVFPGKPKDLFKTKGEKEKLVEAVLAKRSQGEVIREQCTLLESRVSFLDRMVLTVACLVIIGSLFIPWYSVYNERVDEETVPVTEVENAVADADAMMPDSAMLAMADGDSLAVATMATEETAVPEAETNPAEAGATASFHDEESGEEVIHGYVAKKKIVKEYDRLSGLGAIFALGSVGSAVFSSGGVLVITALLLLIYTLLCIALPAYTLYGLYGTKGNDDAKALKIKNILRYNWLPLILFVLVIFLSFFGAEYGFNPEETYISVGTSYGPGALLGTMSWGLIISLGAFILVAAKGGEI